MSQFLLEIDGKKVEAGPDMTVLEAAQAAGIEIPTLCHHEKLVPFGACRLCIVELVFDSWSQLVVSCVYPAKEGLVVKTRSEKVDRVRKTIVELLMAHAPDAPDLKKYAADYDAVPDRFEADPSFCIHCGLCVRYCAEVKQADALGFVGRGVNKEISFIPQIAATACEDCKECFPLCPTSYLQAAYVLTKSLAFQ